MTIRIEIQEQPERQRWWAEVEIGGMVARRRLLDVPFGTDRAAGIGAMLEAVAAAVDEMSPKPKPKPPGPVEEPPPGPRNVDQRRWVDTGTQQADARGDGVIAAIQAEDAERDALRAAAEAAGVRVDKRWGSDRLRQEIAAVAQHGDPADE